MRENWVSTYIILYHRGHTYDGYTLFVPQAGANVFLIEMRGDVVQSVAASPSAG
ncbi:MAG: hypothetical protein WD688_19095 [Candidatus Binatia bacterium]